MSITTTHLSRAAGVSAVAAGLLFLGVQINHPHLDAEFVTTTEWSVRQSLKILMSGLSLAGITGMYLRHVKQSGALGLLGYAVFAVGYLIMMSVEVIGLVVLPAVASSSTGYVNDVLAAATSGHPAGDIGLMQPLTLVAGLSYMLGGLIFGIALFRARIRARWAAMLLAAGTFSSILIPVLPQLNQRLFAVPTGIALVGLGYSLWRSQRAEAGGIQQATDAPLNATGTR